MVVSTSEQHDAHLEDEDVDANNIIQRKRHKHLSPGTWKQNKSETSKRDAIQEQRWQISVMTVGPHCKSKFYQRITLRGCQSITKQQQWIFQKVWSMNTWEEPKLYITTLVTKVDIKQKTVAEGSQRKTTLFYQLKLQDGTSC